MWHARRQQFARSLSGEPGQATAEFAMVLPLLALILFATIEFGAAFWTYQQVSSAASEGARRAAVSRTLSATDRDTAVTTAVRNASPNLTAAEMRVNTASTWSAGAPVTVTVAYPEEITVIGITFFNGDLVSKRTMRVEQ